MAKEKNLSTLTLLAMISFASVNAVLFTPALPNIAHYFQITDNIAQGTITWFLVGYALGQLVYGPLANRFGRKPALMMGISLHILSCLVCVMAGYVHHFSLLVSGRFLMALGSGVGLKMTFTLVNECYEPKIASQKISYLMLAFAITPGLSVALGGFLNAHYGWISCFYAGAIYGLILLMMVSGLPETQKILDYNALKLQHLLKTYITQFSNQPLIAGGLLMGSSTCFIYVFAAVAPFIAINLFGMSSTEYGMANILPPIGLVFGSLIAAKIVVRHSLSSIIRVGILITGVGVILMLVCVLAKLPVLFALFFPTIVIYFGLCFILANASAIAMDHVTDKSHGSAVMNFINMGTATIVVLTIGYFPLKTLLLPVCYLLLSFLMVIAYVLLMKKNN